MNREIKLTQFEASLTICAFDLSACILTHFSSNLHRCKLSWYRSAGIEMNHPVTETKKSIDEISKRVIELRNRFEFVAAIDLLQNTSENLEMDNASARTISRLYCELQRPDLAIATLSEKKFSSNARVLADLAVYNEILGEFEIAEELINECIDRDPDQVEPELVLARILEHQGEYERAYRIVANILQQNRIANPKVAIRALYQLAQCLDQLGSYSKAFDTALKAKEIQRRIPGAKKLSQKGLHTIHRATQIHTAMDKERVKRWRASTDELSSPKMVHLIGHPRSGTTLLGHRLEKYSDVGVASEQDVFLQHSLPRLMGSLENALATTDSLDTKTLVDIRRDYSRLLTPFCGQFDPDGTIIDKRPAHLTFLFGLLRLTPNAKFLVALRDPRDVIVSCFMRFFPLSDMSASLLSLGTTVLFYRNFMSNWFLAKKYLDSESYIEVRYDQLCNQPETTLSGVGEFIGSQLKTTNKPQSQYVHSPTFADVRKQIRSTQVGRWRNYANQLQPFLKTLEPTIGQLGY